MSRPRRRSVPVFRGLQFNPLGQRLYFAPQFNPNCVVEYRQRYTKPRADPSKLQVSAFELLSRPLPTLDTPDLLSRDRNPPTNYQYLGLDWHTSDIVNSCHMDSFLSMFVRLVQSTQGDILKRICCDDEVTKALIKIADHSLANKNRLSSTYVKRMWLDAIGYAGPPGVSDVRGIEYLSIFQHLYGHAGLVIESSCNCGTQFTSTVEFHVSSFAEAERTLLQQHNAYPHMPKCKGCNNLRDYVSLTPVPTSWLFILNFKAPGPLANLSDVRPGYFIGQTFYRLAYLSIVTRNNLNLGHHISLHYIRGNWYLYDGMLTQKFTLWTTPMSSLKNHTLEAAVYVKA